MIVEDIFNDNKGILNNAQNIQPAQAPPTVTTRANQNWGNGNLKVDDNGVYFTPAGTSSSINTDPTVEGRLTGILSKESPYVKAAEAEAQRYANSRGLLNTTMAATAGRKAAIESALPIAQQDAGYFAQRGLNEQQGNIQSRLQGEQGEIQRGLYETQGQIAGRLSKQEAEQTLIRLQEEGKIQSNLSAQEHDQMILRLQEQGGIASQLSSQEAGQEIERAKKAGEIQAGLYEIQGNISERLAAQGYTHEMAMKQADIEWNKIDLQARMDVEFERMDQEDKARYNETTDKIAAEYQQNYLQILADPAYETPEDRQVAINALNQSTQDRFAVANSIAGQELDWGLMVISGGNSNKTSGTTNNQTGTPAPVPVPVPKFDPGDPKTWQVTTAIGGRYYIKTPEGYKQMSPEAIQQWKDAQKQ